MKSHDDKLSSMELADDSTIVFGSVWLKSMKLREATALIIDTQIGVLCAINDELNIANSKYKIVIVCLLVGIVNEVDIRRNYDVLNDVIGCI